MDTLTEQAEKPQAKMINWFTELWRSATRPSLPGTIGALLITAGLFCASILLITPGFMATVKPGMVMLNQHDQYGFLTVRAFHLCDDAPAVPTAVIIGASSLQHSIPDEELMTRMLSEKLGTDARVYNMTAGGTTPWEAAALSDFLDDRIEGLYVIGVSVAKFALPTSNLEFLGSYPRFGFTSEALDAELHAAGFAVPRRTGVYALDNFKFFMARLKSLRHIVTGPAEIHRYSTRRGTVPEEQWPAHIEEWIPFLEVYDENKQPVYETIERLIERLRSGGSDVVLLNGVINPRMMEHIPQEIQQQYEQDIRSFAEELSVEYWDLQDVIGFAPDRFYDRVHIKDPEAREQYGDVLTDRLAEVFRQRSAATPGGAS